MLVAQTIWCLHEIILALRLGIASEITRERTDEYATFLLDGMNISLFRPYPIQFLLCVYIYYIFIIKVYYTVYLLVMFPSLLLRKLRNHPGRALAQPGEIYESVVRCTDFTATSVDRF